MKRGRRLSIAHSSGSALAVARIDLGLTQEQLAKLAGVTKQTVMRHETGKGRPLLATALGIVNALGRTVCEFWPLLAKAIEAGRLLDTAIPITRAVKPEELKRFNVKRVAHEDLGGSYVHHEHRPPFCCGQVWARVVDLSDPETYRSIPGSTRIAAGGANA